MKFKIIYADPPWDFEVYSRDTGQGRSAASHYPTMNLADIKNLPVGSIAADDCVLFMWVVNPQLPEALEVLKAWGFKYKTVAFNWIKTNKIKDSYFWGMGFWTRANGEELWMALKENSPQPYLYQYPMELFNNDRVSLITEDEEFLVSQKMLLATKGHPKRVSAGIHQIVDAPVIIEKIGEHSAKPPIFRDLIVQLMGNLPRIELFAREFTPGWNAWGNEVGCFEIPGFPQLPISFDSPQDQLNYISAFNGKNGCL